eukprot:GHVS01098828.1.p1 GENE.GHVS01098828.1~~GHVS01098828.1.p1  ORF type:complete len:773 (-),score=121.06 GHVS01098828.1:560-2878(-)
MPKSKSSLGMYSLYGLSAHIATVLFQVALYGATSGKAFFRGIAAERFAVRNSGAEAVVEGTGDHAFEYMTGGTVVVLGQTGINCAAGMSGGVAYVYDPQKLFAYRCNSEMVALVWGLGGEKVVGGQEELNTVRRLIEEHVTYTKSTVGSHLLADWTNAAKHFVRVLPQDYKRVLGERLTAKATMASELLKRNEVDKRADASPEDLLSPLTTAEATPLEELSVEYGNGEKWRSEKPATIVENVRPGKVLRPIKRRGFIEYEREVDGYRNANERMEDFMEIYQPHDETRIRTQAARCMDCGVPFCQSPSTGCPLGNLIPEWNKLAYEGRWEEALDRLLETNNFPEFTGRVCPAPCEGACVLGVIDDPVSIKNIECTIIDRAFAMGWMAPRPPPVRTGRHVAVVGSGPAGMAAADQMNKTGHRVTVFERSDRAGGLMMYGVPNMKADKVDVVQRRVDLMQAEGVKFRCGENIGGEKWLAGGEDSQETTTSVEQLRSDYDAVLLASGSTVARDLPVKGRQFEGIHLAMEYLHGNTKKLLNAGPHSRRKKWRETFETNLEVNGHDGLAQLDVRGKKVVVIGGGDTGNDCIGTAVRQGAESVINFELLPRPPAQRKVDNPWPEWPLIYRVDYGHEEVTVAEGNDPRAFMILTKEFVGNTEGRVSGIRTVEVDWEKNTGGKWVMKELEETEKLWEADFVFLCMGFTGPERGLAEQMKVEFDNRGNFAANYGDQPRPFHTNVDGVFAAGDCRRGQSLVVWAISEGRQAAAAINRFLAGAG